MARMECNFVNLEIHAIDAAIRKLIFDGNPPKEYPGFAGRPFELAEMIIKRMDEKNCPFLQVSWAHPRIDIAKKTYVAEFWSDKLRSSVPAMGPSVLDAIIFSALAAAQGRIPFAED